MSYYLEEAKRLGIQSTKLKEVIVEIFSEPNQDRLRLLGAALAAAKMRSVPDSPSEHDCEYFLGFVAAEREWLRAKEGLG